ncbi:MAG: hypothetical protein V1781_02360 [Bacteroidota bacterium]
MKQKLLETLSRNFDYLIPRDYETIFLLILLYERIDKQEIDEAFSQNDFEDAVDEVSFVLQRSRGIQKENISKRLSQHFYTTLKIGDNYKFQLTIYAKELIKLILNEITPDYEKLELIYTFKRTLPLQEDDISSIDKLEYWHKHHYHASQKVIISHTDNLHRFVDEKISELRQILKPQNENPKELIAQFLIIFEQLGKHTEGITNALNFKQDVIDKIKNSEKNFKSDKDTWERHSKILHEITDFFETIDCRVLSINDKIQQARSRLKSLYDNLRYKQQYKLKIEKLLLLFLKHVKVKEDEVTFPEIFKMKELPHYKERFLYPPFLDFSNVQAKESPPFTIDEEYKQKVELEKMKMLNRQESTMHWLDEIKKEIEVGREIIFEDWFCKIFEEQQNLEVPIDVCYNLIEKYNGREDVEVKIEKKLIVPQNNNIALWKLKIHPTNS